MSYKCYKLQNSDRKAEIGLFGEKKNIRGFEKISVLKMKSILQHIGQKLESSGANCQIIILGVLSLGFWFRVFGFLVSRRKQLNSQNFDLRKINMFFSLLRPVLGL
ncbi:hypothetical protein ABFS83_02G020700 [Erythranthe nasuta]